MSIIDDVMKEFDASSKLTILIYNCSINLFCIRNILIYGGERGIRTPGSIATTHAFQGLR